MALQETHLSVLLVEDNPGDARLVEHHLQTATSDQYLDSHALTHVDTLDAGLEALEAEPFDVLLLDLGLPESTGLATLERVTDAGVDLPVVVLTGLSDRETSVEAIKRGAQDYLPKDDLDPDRLLRAVRYALERHQQERRLQRQAEQLEFFNAILHHDMLNGMNVILARGELLADAVDGPEAAAAETIVEWSDDIIDLTEKIRSTLETLADDDAEALRAVPLGPAAETAAARARSKGATTTVDVPDDLAVRADPLLADVLANLTMNAAVHGAPDDGEVHVHIDAETEGRTVRLRVSDDGVGIDPAIRESLFQRGATGGSSAGSGFGLYFVASMVDAYGGEVSVESPEEGGTTFTLELPGAAGGSARRQT